MTDEIQAHTLLPPTHLREVRTLVDIGAGLRPVQWWPQATHVCVEPFWPYVERLRRHGYLVIHNDAEGFFLDTADQTFEGVYLLDVLEHMSRVEGERVLRHAQRVASVQVVVYTPLGFLDQREDAWGLGGEYWQTHRSGWLPEEFGEDWVCEPSSVGDSAFFALWTRRGA